MNEQQITTYVNILMQGIGHFAASAGGEAARLPEQLEAWPASWRQLLQEALATEGKLGPGLVSVLGQLKLDKNKPNQSEVHHFSPGPLQGQAADTFPKLSPGLSHEKWLKKHSQDPQAWQAAWQAFQEDLLKLGEGKDLQGLSYSLYYLLFKHFARLPNTQPALSEDVSLFDQNRIQAALACCDFSEAEDKENPYLLLKGDISGVQKFIYSDIDMGEAGNTRDLSKKLRGRSFYVALLTDFVADRFVERLGLAEAHVIYSGGGHFLLVAPNRTGLMEEVEALQKNINMMLLDKIGSRTSLLVGKTSCGKDFVNQPATYIQEVNASLSQQKYRKHEAYLEDHIFRDKEILQDTFVADKKLGGRLPYASEGYLLEIETQEALALKINPKDSDDPLVADFQLEDSFHYFFLIENKADSSGDLHDVLGNYEQQIKKARLIALNHTDFLEHASYCARFHRDIPLGFGFRFVGTYAPVKDKKVLDFEALEALNDVEEEIERLAKQLMPEGLERSFEKTARLSHPQLAVMRLDVDNLGELFAFGLQDRPSLARVASLSRELYLFFSGYVNNLAKRYAIYVTYSGGDDAFVVGSWLNVIHFARELRREFRRFACENPDLTFSAGIFLCDAHYPVAKFAQKAADREEEAKEYVRKGGDEKQAGLADSKDAISVFDHVLSWKDFEGMFDFSLKLLSYTKWGQDTGNEKRLSRALVHRILRLIKGCIDEDGQLNSHKLYRNATYLRYLFARHGYTEGLVEGEEEAKKKVHRITQQIAQDIIKVFLDHFNDHKTREQMLANYLIPTHYVTLKTRTTNERL